jgi:predicted GIY-YIG superfamily endonuclease
MEKRFFVYVLANRPKGVLYVGVTNDLQRRLYQHRVKRFRDLQTDTEPRAWSTMRIMLLF